MNEKEIMAIIKENQYVRMSLFATYKYHTGNSFDVTDRKAWKPAVEWFPTTSESIRDVILVKLYMLCNGLDYYPVDLEPDEIIRLFVTALQNNHRSMAADHRFKELKSEGYLDGSSSGPMLTLKGRAHVEQILGMIEV